MTDAWRLQENYLNLDRRGGRMEEEKKSDALPWLKKRVPINLI
jgi:hypothetical protein